MKITGDLKDVFSNTILFNVITIGIKQANKIKVTYKSSQSNEYEVKEVQKNKIILKEGIKD